MAKKTAIIKGGRVVSTHVTGKWIDITVRIPIPMVAVRGTKRLPGPLKAKVARAARKR
jgi:hypothetical protein